MITESTLMRRSADFVSHLDRFPEDLRDIRRLQRRFRLSAEEVAAALDTWRADPDPSRQLKEMLSH
ncbi:hypothetical protein K2Z84_27900 [Candidatus Binatia bacterium]|jgi:hypothetical protein|nr:hypothetical protein [Candidatus Binatia bacterium]